MRRICSDTEWLVMLYLAGDNNLTEDMVLGLQLLKGETGPDTFKIVAQLDPSGRELSTQKYDFTGSKNSEESLRTYLEPEAQSNDINTGDPRALRSFIRWADAKYSRAQHRLLILSGHGSGATQDFLLKDESSKDSLTLAKLRLALSSAMARSGRGSRASGNPPTIDVLGLDACYMSMAEVCYEVRDHARIVVASEGLVPRFGWPYGRMLRTFRRARLERSMTLKPEDLSRLIVEAYVEFYADHDRAAGRSVDLAAIRLNKMESVAAGVEALGAALGREVRTNPDAIVLSHWYAQTYKSDQFIDLRDFCLQLYGRMPTSRQVRQACQLTIAALDGGTEALQRRRPLGSGAIIKSGCSGFAYQHSYGISLYFPWSVVSQTYRNTLFAQRTSWDRFLDLYVRHTARENRFRIDDSERPSLKRR